MADIARYPFTRHLRGTPTTWVRHQRRGGVAHEGVGQAFFFRPLPAVLSEVPVDDRELPLLFHARTADFQDLAVQATVTYRVVAPERTADRVDFGLDVTTGTWRGDPLQQVATLVTELAQQPALDLLARVPLRDALGAGVAPVRDAVAAALADEERLEEIGIAVRGVRVVALRPEPDVERALQTPTREQVQTDADGATYARRALAVERERAIAENELANQLELARREEELVGQRGTNERRRATEAAEAAAVEARGRAERDRLLADARADVERVTGAAEVEVERDRLAAAAETPLATLAALAARDLAASLPRVDTLVLAPDQITAALTALVRPAAPAGDAAPVPADR